MILALPRARGAHVPRGAAVIPGTIGPGGVCGQLRQRPHSYVAVGANGHIRLQRAGLEPGGPFDDQAGVALGFGLVAPPPNNHIPMITVRWSVPEPRSAGPGQPWHHGSARTKARPEPGPRLAFPPRAVSRRPGPPGPL